MYVHYSIEIFNKHLAIRLYRFRSQSRSASLAPEEREWMNTRSNQQLSCYNNSVLLHRFQVSRLAIVIAKVCQGISTIPYMDSDQNRFFRILGYETRILRYVEDVVCST
ncbi:hypothetical protein WN55_09707 [Dufourea novaeangliae]|uniref:Uncharacterized protein n=1 Tax=Dufourea novaeangliae TaxID=178035 RepID=A0A154P0Y7_DUFNO|nr:hypothetical protein WN55_09707 [Dufourea novaeangliae]